MSTEPTQKQPNFSFELYRLLLIRGIARALAPIAVLTSILHWWLISWVHGVVFAALTINYVLVYALMWISPPLTNGPWRVRAWQTFVLLINVFALPIVWYRHRGTVPWIFIAVNILFFVGLFAATKIMFYFQERLPMGQIFAARKGDTTMPPPPALAKDAHPVSSESQVRERHAQFSLFTFKFSSVSADVPAPVPPTGEGSDLNTQKESSGLGAEPHQHDTESS